MKFSIFAIAALAAPAAAASRKTKISKKGGSLRPTPAPTTPPSTLAPTGVPPGGFCTTTDDCAIPVGLNHGVCRNCKRCRECSNPRDECQSGQPGSLCGQTTDCVPIAGLEPPHAVCRQGKCQQGVKGGYCGQDSDCLTGKCKGVTGLSECN